MSEALFDAQETVPQIAVVGFSGRFPGARTVAELWRNLCAGVESVSSFTVDELAASGIDPRLLADPRYVRAKGVLEDADLFDAALFGFTPREAEHMDPQHRVFLECVWEALEDAGCDPRRHAGRAGVYAGCAVNTYLLFNLLPHRELMEKLGVMQLMLLNDRDFLATRVSHKLDLRGPSVAVQTACSTSLVAIHLACQALLTGECDLALAGGVSISTPLVSGYLYQEGSVMSPDGHCRAFDAAAAGAVEGNGCGVVVLKRLADALEDGDRIRAVVRGSAVTNDGASRVGFTAPSVEGQAAAISEALLISGVDPDTIGYVETHGSGTPLGDPIEIEALTQAFRRAGARGTHSCAIGSAKTNLGHCNTAAGVAGFLKAVLALENRTLPPSLNFERPNPRIDFAASPFRVATACAPWESAEAPRRAGVSSFGLGGTNAHAVLEEAPAPEPGDPPSRPAQLLVLSARTPEALDAAAIRLAEHLESHPDLDLADAAWTLQTGRRELEHRRAVVARGREAAVAALRASVGTAPGFCEEPGRRSVAFLFPGLGDQSVDMARELYETEPVFREQVDLCAGRLADDLGCDLREVLFSPGAWSRPERRGPDLRAMLRRDGPEESPAAARLRQTVFAQPACFVVEFALACLLMHWGVAPRALIGYSVGEYVAACLAGVLSLDDALSLVARRAKLIQDLPPGAMLAVPLAEEAVRPLLDARLSVSATNGPHFCVVGGPEDAVGELERELAGRGAGGIRLQTTHAFHSAMMEPAAAALTAIAGTVETKPPRIPCLSNVTGTWIAPEDVADPGYWSRHMRGTVRFAEGLGELLRESGRVYVEIGPGATLGTLVRQHPDATADLLTVPTLGRGGDTEDLLAAVGRLWEAGVEIDWERFYGGERRLRVPLPTYPFERRRFWVDPPDLTPVPSPIALPSPGRGAPPPGWGFPPLPVGGRAMGEGGQGGEESGGGTAQDRRKPGLSTPYVTPRNEAEASLAAIWEDLFGFAPIGVEDDFLELGGQSLLAIQVIARVQTAFGVTLTAASLFEAPTVAGLAAEVERARGEETPEELEELLALVEGLSPEEAGRQLASLPEVPQPPPGRASQTPEGIPRVSGPGGAGDWPLSYDQERLWFVSLLDPESTAYNMTTATRLLGRLDVPALAWSFDEVLRRQGAWRATFPAVAGSPVQRIAAEAHLPLAVVDLAALPDAMREAAVLDLVAAAARQPFDLDRGPLLRASLIRLGEREHVCLVAVHHIASDGLTLQLFWSELAALYPARLAGRAAALPELPIQYPDFVLWQRGRLQGEALDRQLAWWTERLRGFPLVLDLPADRPRPAAESMRGGQLPVRVGPETTGRLRELARREGATRFMLITALCAALCHRLSGQEKLILGTLNANRNRSELQPLFGFFLTQLPLAVDLTGDPPLRELLARVRAVAVEAYAHPDLPFGKLVEALQPDRELGLMPVVQALVQLIEQQAAAGQSLGDLRLEPLDVHDGNARYDVMFPLIEDAGSIHGSFEYNAEIFDATTAARMIDLFHAMTEAAAADPSLRVSALPAFSAAARQQVLVEWNDTAAGDLAPTVVELFAKQAARTPEAIAWTGDGWSLTYADLDERSGRLARHLHRLGLGPEDLVGIYLERTVELPVALLGVLRSGAAYLPLDPAHPAERRAFLLADAGAALVLTRERLLPGLPAGVRAVCLDSGWGEIAVQPAAPPRVRIEPESRAYVIYTSGSTGAPKGAEIPHRALANFVRAMRRLYTVEAGDAMPAITTTAFDLSVPELYLPMLGGGTTPLLGRDTAADGALLARALDDRGATVLQATPATYRMLLDSGWQGRPELLLLCGAEPLHRDLADRLLPLGRGLWNFYGPTETTVWSTAWQVEERGPISLGRPIAETRIHLLDRRFAPVPLGAAGEICIGGAGLARGYLRRPDLTADRFVPDPLSGEPGARLYRTGDLGRFRPDGRLDHLGRADHQVKLRGFRIEPGEIEAALRGHPAVAEAVVMLREDRPGDPRLVAWLETAAGAAAPTAAELRDLLRRRLPDYMVPAAFVALPALPRNANGKLDRRALPAPEALAARPGAEPMAPRDEVEAEVAAIWQRLLEVERVGVDDDFFELGGHSLLANRVLAAVRDRLGAEVPLRALFQAPTVAGVAAAVRRARAAAEPGGLPPIERQPRRPGTTERFPVSFSQLREWILDRLEPGTPAYNVPAPVRVAGPLSLPLLAASLRELVRRHESLRTTFEAGPEEPLQVVAPHLDLALPVIDLEALPGPAREPELRRLLEEDLGLGFDLAAGPLLRARAVRLGPEAHAVLVTIHHIVSDGWSIGVFLRDLGEVYDAFSHGRSSPLPELAIQYPDYAVWQRQRLRGELLDEQVRWWRDQLAGAPPLLELPTDRPRPPVRSSRGAELPVTLPRSVAEPLQALAARQGTSLFAALLAGFQALLARLSGQEDVCAGTFASNRPRTELEGLIGFFVNTLVLRTDLSGDPSFAELTARVRETALGVQAHQELPFEKLLEALDVPRDPSRTPLFQAMLVLQTFPRQRIDLSRITLTPLAFEARRANFDLTLWLTEGPDGLDGYVDFSTDLFEPATVARMMGHLRTLLATAVADPERRLWSLPLLAPEERAEILEGWSRTVEEPPGPPLLHRLVEAWAERTPRAVAVETADGGRLTYEELDARADRLARHLRGLGVGPEARVGLAAERSPEMLVGMLAVLKAGGAYVPLDPGYPRERLEFMLEDSAAAVLLLQERLAGSIPAGRAHVVLLDGPSPPAPLPSPSLPPGEGRSAAQLLGSFPPLPDGREGMGEGGQGGEGSADPDNPAYVIYTSGSTGRPKGVVVSHRAISAYTRTAREYYAMGPADRVLQLGSISFDTSAEEIYPALAAGATVVLRSADMVVSMRHFLAELDRLKITLLALQTAFWHEIVAGLIEGLDLPPSMRLVAFGGEAALLDRLEAWRRRVGPGVRLVNTYGPTEATIVSTYRELAEPEDDPEVPIGRPIPGARVYVVDRRFEPAPPGAAGELLIGGAGLARGYLGRPDLTAERFVPDPFSREPGARLYDTGDLARFRAGGDLLFCGRADRQLKLRGYRIEPGEIEAALRLHPALRDAVADLRGRGEDARLVAWVVAREGTAPGAAELRAFLRDRLPEPMVPSLFVTVPALPLTPSGKLDRRALPEPEGARPSGQYTAPAGALERTVAGIFAELLRIDRVGRDDSFFDLGGHSLLMVRAHQRLCQALGREIPVVDLFRFPTVARLARHLGQAREEEDPTLRRVQLLAGRRKSVQDDRIAVVGMSGRFPGARSVEQLWARLRDGVDCIRDLTDEDLRESGLDPAALPPGYVRRAAVVDGVELFDASFFGCPPEEAEILDPQLRLFLECAWEALESAAWVPDETRPEQVGVFAGTGLPAYLMSHLLPHPRIQETVEPTQLLLANDRDFFVSRVAYELDLRGPALAVQSASSTSLAAVHLACESLLSGQCTLAIAGGVRIAVPQKAGYLARDGMLPPDGRCRAFDAAGRGSLSGSGVGVVALKRLEDALADGDPIHAVILGSACNSDGALRVGFTAPSVEGQAEAIALAQAQAGVGPETLGYVEAHGSGTRLGDAIEVAALTRAFRAGTRARGFCALGSIKTNVGHLESAAGIAGLIKAVLAVERGAIPPSLHFETPNPEIDFAESPFYVNTELREWPRNGAPRRAGVSSFGMGGTNVHVILEEPPEPEPPPPPAPATPWHLLVLSARTPAALDRRTDDLADWLEAHPDADLADVAHTLQAGRRAFPHRRALLCRGREDALAALRSRGPLRLLEGVPASAAHLAALARQWLAGEPVDWTRWAAPGKRRKLHLPTYPFERQRCWVDRP